MGIDDKAHKKKVLMKGVFCFLTFLFGFVVE